MKPLAHIAQGEHIKKGAHIVQIVTIANQKGGTAKSTTAAALAQAAAATGRKCLAIDLDPQGNLSFFLQADTGKAGSYELLTGTPARDCIQHTPGGLDVIAASWNLSTVTSSKGSARRLQQALKPLQLIGVYDLVIVDTPPTAGELQYNALQASTDLIIPLQADIVGLQGLYQIADTAQQIQQSNPALRIAGFVITRQQGRSTLARQLQERITAEAAARNIPFMGCIREAVAIREAQTLQRSLYEYAPNSKPAQDYLQLLDKLQ